MGSNDVEEEKVINTTLECEDLENNGARSWKAEDSPCFNRRDSREECGNGPTRTRRQLKLSLTRYAENVLQVWRRYPSWALPALVAVLIVLLSWPVSAPTRALTDPPRQSNGLSSAVQWDNYTLFINDQRVLIHSGEFHTFRLPVPELWLDVFQKMVAVGFNAVSVYIHMGLTNPSRGVLDFDDWRSLKGIYDAASKAGIFVVVRPGKDQSGPYINAETTAGGISAWVTSEVSSVLRTNATDWTEAYEPFIDGIIKGTKDFQVTEGGPVIAVQIDNEYDQDEITGQYFENLLAQYREGGIVVPLTYNDPNMRRAFVNGTGAVDIYGMDGYPQAFDCSNPHIWRPVVTTYHQYHAEVNPSQPWYMPEFQGGAFDPWAGPGYDACAILTGPEFEDVFYKQNWAANAKLLSYYMFYGGTNWGGIAFPGVYTSYDYGSPMHENRMLSEKYDELKRQGLFLRSSPEFRKTDWVGESSSGISGVTLSSEAAFVTYLRNPDSGTGFFITRQNDSTSTDNIIFKITVPTLKGSLTLPGTTDGVALHGRQSKLIITDYHFGAAGSLAYTTATIFFAGTIGSRDVLFLYGASDQSHEFAFTPSGPGFRSHIASLQFGEATRSGVMTVTVFEGSVGLVTVWESESQLVLFSDPVTAATFWAPPVFTSKGSSVRDLETFWQFGTNTTVLVGGPYLVRNATIDGATLALRGDLIASAMLTVIAPPEVTKVTWNGQAVEADFGSGAIMTASLSHTLREEGITVPELKGWVYQDSLPEIQPGFDDSEWIVANKTHTNIVLPPQFGDGRVLYGCDYGFCENSVLFRGHFHATGSETGANLTIYGGSYFAASVWINDRFIGSVQTEDDHANHLFTFPEGALVVGQDNVLTVLHDNQGLEEDDNDQMDNEKSPRGIAGFALEGGKFTIWRVQGKLGGYTNYPDKVRGLLNEGGLYAERQGWHLPGFDTSSWTSRELSEGLPSGGAGVGFFVTTFDLDIPSDTDVPLSFEFEDLGQAYRALMFVNGWQYGKRVANVGPQNRFPVPQGILDYSGTNTLAIALWSLNDTAVSPSLQLVVDGVIEGGVGPIHLNNPAWSPRA